MAEFTADVRDVKFALLDQAGFERLFDTERYKDLDRDTVEAIIDEAYKFARNRLAPTNTISDRVGAKHDKQTLAVTVPPEVHEVRKEFVENGWLGLTHTPEWGGQGMPYSLGLAASDFFFGASLAFSLETMLTAGAAHLVEAFGTDALKKTYLENMYSGVWAGTMCLTEAQAGSDVGAARTKAKPNGDHYLIEGEKIFITFGDHDLTDNVIHAVLARVEGAPEGTKGLSLFLVPKVLVNDDGSLGDPNDVACVGIEHKMGIHGSPTCTMAFGQNGQCKGWLLGEEGKGMRAMFQMMNEARIHVGLQGAALANAAYQYALQYAKERMQFGKPIIRHPDVRQMLMMQKAISEGTRSLLLRTAFFFDMAESSTDPAEKERYEGMVELLTPICKAYASDQGFRSIELSMQTLGGYGYISEYPVEQYMRDTKIASIYEGTNGIQALDLMGRKLPAKGGADFKALIGMLAEFGGQHQSHPALEGEMALLAKGRDAVAGAAMHFAKAGAENPLVPMVEATPFLDLMGQLVVGWLLLEQATLAWPKLEEKAKAAGVDLGDRKAMAKWTEDDEEARFYDGKVKVARFWARRKLATLGSQAKSLMAGDMSAMEANF